METRNEIRPFLPQHPGTILKEELKARGLKQKAFAEMIGMRPSHLSALLHGARNISPQLAAKIESVLQIPARVWLNLQDNYNLDMLRTSDLVAGYNPQPVSFEYAFAEQNQEEKKLWNVAFKAGQNDTIHKVKEVLKDTGMSEDQVNSVLKKLREA